MTTTTKIIAPFTDITVRNVGLVSRDYNIKYPNGYRDFSHNLPDILAFLDEKGCDTALFSLYSLIPRPEFDVLLLLKGLDLKHLKMLCVEEFKDTRHGRKAGQYVVYYRTADGWEGYSFLQAFGRVDWQRQVDTVRAFAQNVIPKRVIGNSCIIVCGESNGVRVSHAGDKAVSDPCGIMAVIPEHVKIILNPVHDKMQRPEMIWKRRYLSKNNRWVLSVWNKGKKDRNGRQRDGDGPAWTVFCDGHLIPINTNPNSLGVEIGIVNYQNGSLLNERD